MLYREHQKPERMADRANFEPMTLPDKLCRSAFLIVYK